MKVLITVDSRVADTAGVVFIDLQSGESHFIRTYDSQNITRNGYRGGVLVEGTLYTCTSYEVHVLEVEWRDASPKVRLIRRFQRPEWLIGQRANNDLHGVWYDKPNGDLLVANTYMDCIDRLDEATGELIDRAFLWDISPEIMQMGLQREKSAADLCHLNHITRLGDELILTVGNFNGTRRGGVVSGNTGEILASDLQFPHDAFFHDDSMYITEAEAQRLTIFEGVNSAGDLTENRRRHIPIAPPHLGSLSSGRIWVRGVTVVDDYVLVGCSQFNDLKNEFSAVPSHIRLFRRDTLEDIGSIFLPMDSAAPEPVLYSILPISECASEKTSAVRAVINPGGLVERA